MYTMKYGHICLLFPPLTITTCLQNNSFQSLVYALKKKYRTKSTFVCGLHWSMGNLVATSSKNIDSPTTLHDQWKILLKRTSVQASPSGLSSLLC